MSRYGRYGYTLAAIKYRFAIRSAAVPIHFLRAPLVSQPQAAMLSRRPANVQLARRAHKHNADFRIQCRPGELEVITDLRSREKWEGAAGRNNISRSAIFCPSEGTLSELIAESPRLSPVALPAQPWVLISREKERNAAEQGNAVGGEGGGRLLGRGTMRGDGGGGTGAS